MVERIEDSLTNKTACSTPSYIDHPRCSTISSSKCNTCDQLQQC